MTVQYSLPWLIYKENELICWVMEATGIAPETSEIKLEYCDQYHLSFCPISDSQILETHNFARSEFRIVGFGSFRDC